MSTYLPNEKQHKNEEVKETNLFTATSGGQDLLQKLVQAKHSFHLDFIQSNQEPAYGLYEKVIEIEKWFHEERHQISTMENTNTPLVIVGPEGSGKTSLLFQWMEFHEAKSEFFTNITIFDLNQRIEMQNDKIRTFFFRWLELAHNKKSKTTTDKCKIILVIDGIDRLEMEENSSQNSNQQQFQNNVIQYKFEEESPDWFPQCYPESFRVIVTCKKNSKAYKSFKNQKVPFRFLYMPDPNDKTLISIVENHFALCAHLGSQQDIKAIKDQLWEFINQNRQSFSNFLYLHTVLNILYPQNLNLTSLKLQPPTIQEISDKITVEELFKFVLKHYETRLLPRSKFRRISCILALSKTGLKKEELKDCLEVKIETIELFLSLFQFALLEYKSLFRINNEQYNRTIEKFYLQEELFKNEIHSSIVTILSKVKHFNSNARLIDEVTYNIYKQGNQWLRLKDLLSNLEIFCHLYKPQDKYILATYWQKLEQHGFDPIYEYNKTMEAFVLNYFPTHSELFVILTQLARFFKEFGDLETKLTAEFRHPSLVISPELRKIKLSRELRRIGGMLIEIKNNITPISDDDKYSVQNYLFMQVYRDKQVELLNKENPLFPSLQLYYYKRWIWLQFPWFCMDINGSFSAYMKKTMGKSIHLHMNTSSENDLVFGSLRIIKEAKSRKQNSGKQQIYVVPQEFVIDDERSENSEIRDGENPDQDDTKFSTSSDESLTSKRDQIRSPTMSIHQRNSAVGNNMILQTTNQSAPQTPIKKFLQSDQQDHNNNGLSIGRARFYAGYQSQSRLSSAAPLTQRYKVFGGGLVGFDTDRKSQYVLAKSKWIDQDYELANIKKKLKPENAVRVVANQVKNYERKELENAIQANRELVNEYNKIAFEIQQKEKFLQNLQNCIIQLDTNSKENQAYEKKLQHIQDRLDSTKTQYKISKQEQNRLRHIVNFCFKNKADNHEWIHGLERGVKNMTTLIKHEKEQIINAKNLVLELNKEKKELKKLKDERKMLQQMTTEQMYGMIQEKQSIKLMREEFDKRKEFAMRMNTFEQSLEEQSISSQQKSKTLSLTKQGSSFQLLNMKKSARHLLQEDKSPLLKSPLLSNDQVQKLIVKLDKVRMLAGAKHIEDFQQMIEFLQNYQRMTVEKDEKESQVMLLREHKKTLLEELQQFHNKDIEISNQKYEPHRLQNTIQAQIVNQSIQRNFKQEKYKKWLNHIIQIRILIEEMRKKVGLNTTLFLKPHQEISGEEMIQQLVEVQEQIQPKMDFIQHLFGTMTFNETMDQINQADAKDLRVKILQLKQRSRVRLLNHQSHTGEHRTHDGVVLHEQQDPLSQEPAILLKDEDEEFPMYDLIPERNSNMNSKEKGTLKQKTDQKSRKNSKRPSKIFPPDMQLKSLQIGQQSKQLTLGATLQSRKADSSKQINEYQTIVPFLDESSYTQSIMNLSKTRKEKEQIFYRRVSEFEKESDVVKQTMQAIVDFKRKIDSSIQENSMEQMEEERARQKNKNKPKQTEIVLNQLKRVYSSNELQRPKILKTPIINNFQQTGELKNLKHNHHQQKEEDQDIEPAMMGNNEEGSSPNKNEDHNHQHHSLTSRILASSGGLMGNQTDRPRRRRISINTIINQEQHRLPQYTKHILTNNHKDLLKRLYEMKSNIMKYDKDEIIKKLAAQNEKRDKQPSKFERFHHQNL